MTKIYAIVRPAVYKKQDSGWFDAITSLLIQPYYYLRYEAIGNYTLAYEPIFYLSLDEAKRNFHPVPVSGYVFFAQRAQQNAIIEMELIDDVITGITALYAVTSMHEELIPIYSDDKETIINHKETVVVWLETDVNPISLAALSHLNKHYQKQCPNADVISALPQSP